MADRSAEKIAQLEQRISVLRQRLHLRETQIAGYGSLDVPPHMVIDRDEAERELQQAQADLDRLRASPAAEGAPYLGLLTFHEQDAGRFFGRAALVAELVERAGRAPFLAVLGPSGSGKSSVIRAGLIPMLKGGALPGSQHWRYLTIKPGARPLDVLATELTKLQGGDVSNVLLLSRQLAETERALLLAASLLLDRATGQRLVLVVDQAEELWTLAPVEPEARANFVNQQQRPFIDQLLSAAAAPDAPLLISLTMRADFLHRAAEHPALARAIGDHDLIVSPMMPDELREAIERPAELAGGGFEAGLVDELIKQTTGREGALPLLEYTLLELWNARRTNGTLAWETFRAIGGVEGALAQTADSILANRYTDAQRDELRAILVRLVQPGEGAADTRRRVALTDLAPAAGSADTVQALLAPLVEARLLVVTTTDDRRQTIDETTAVADTVQPSSIVLRPSSEIAQPSSSVLRPSSAQVEVAHEALIRSWPALRAWVDAARADLRFQIQFEEAAQEWDRSRKSADFLWGGLRLANAETWIARSHPRLNARDQTFLVASRAQEQAHNAEKAATTRRLRRLAITLAAAAVVAVLLAIAAGVFGVQSRQSATDARAQGATAVAEKQRADAQGATAVASGTA